MAKTRGENCAANLEKFLYWLERVEDKSSIALIPLRENKVVDAPKGFDIKTNIDSFRLTPDQVIDRLSHGLNYGIYALAGGLCFIDIDVSDKKLLITSPQLLELQERCGTLTIRTRNGGRHFCFINDTPEGNAILYVNNKKVGELRKSWQYVVGPGSYYPQDEEAGIGADGIYTVTRNIRINNFSRAELPTWLKIKPREEPIQVVRIKGKRDIFVNDDGKPLSEIMEKDKKLVSLLHESVVKSPGNDRSVTDAALVTKLHWWGFDHTDIASILCYYRPYEKTDRLDYLERTIGKFATGPTHQATKFVKKVELEPEPEMDVELEEPPIEKPKRKRFKEPEIVKKEDIDSFLLSFIGSLTYKGFNPEQITQKIKLKVSKGEIEGNLSESFWFATKIPEKIQYCNTKHLEDIKQKQDSLPDCIKSDTVVDAQFLERISKFRLDGIGNAERFLAYYEKDLRYNIDTEMWHVWNGQTWEPKHESEIQVLAITVARNIYNEVVHIKDDNQRPKHSKWAIDSNDRGGVGEMVVLSRGFVVIRQSSFDTLPNKINMKNGVYNLETLEFEEGGIKEELHSRQTKVAYDENATCPKWEEHINLILQGKQDMIDTLQISLGYSLLGQHAEYLFVPFGSGRNGKGITLQVIRGILGTYAGSVDVKTITTSSFDKGIREDLANLRGLRFVYAEEPDRNAKLDTASIKKWTGGGEIKACYKYGHEFTYEPTFALWLNTNHMPKINETTTAIKERLRMFPFNYTIPKEDRVDPVALVKHFIDVEGPGIFNWLIDGLCKYQELGGIPFCDNVLEASNRAILENDKLERCIQDIAVIDQMATVSIGEWFIAVGNWCKENDEVQYMTKQALKKDMEEKGFDKTRSNVARGWKGLRLKTQKELESGQQNIVTISDKVTMCDAESK